MDLSTNIKFRHILAQEGQANNIKVINNGIRKETCQKNYKEMLGSKNMLGKPIKRKGCGLQLKSYIHTPKPQFQDMKPRRGTLSARTLPCDCGEKRRIKGIWICLGEKSQRKRERICPKSKKKKKEVSGSIYSQNMTLQLLAAVGHLC